MQNKIPFGATIAHGYRFFASQFVNLALLSLAPLLVLIIAGGLSLGPSIQMMSALKANDPAGLSAFAVLIPLYIAVCILHVSIFTMISEYALGLRPPSLFSIPFGKPTWRVLGAAALAALVLILGLIIFGLALILVGTLLGILLAAVMPAGLVTVVTSIGAVLVIFFVYGAVFYALFRLVFLIVPVTLMSQRIDLTQSWRLTKGNFWRIFGIWWAIFLPMIIVEYVLIFAAIGFPPSTPAGMSPEAELAASMTWNIAMIEAFQIYWYVSIPFLFVATIFLCGAFAGAQAFAYRALTGESSAPVTGDSLPDR